jgi:two-component system capsular synthesis response regulator RcsB
MFEKVLIAEDFESASIAVRKTLEDLGIKNLDYVYYCDDALMQVQKAIQAVDPYDLLITDLSFVEDHRPQKIKGGAALIAAIKQIQPSLKVLVFSVENRASVADELKKELGIDAYVPKARRDAEDLKLAIETISKNRKYSSPQLKRDPAAFFHDFTPFDIEIISMLSEGIAQKTIPYYLKEKGVTPAGLSSVEKRLNYVKTALNISKNEQLIAYCKDKKII